MIWDVLSTFQHRDRRARSLTASEVAAQLDCSRRTALNKLTTLAAEGRVARRQVGGRARVWWVPNSYGEIKNASIAGSNQKCIRLPRYAGCTPNRELDLPVPRPKPAASTCRCVTATLVSVPTPVFINRFVVCYYITFNSDSSTVETLSPSWGSGTGSSTIAVSRLYSGERKCVLGAVNWTPISAAKNTSLSSNSSSSLPHASVTSCTVYKNASMKSATLNATTPISVVTVADFGGSDSVNVLIDFYLRPRGGSTPSRRTRGRQRGSR